MSYWSLIEKNCNMFIKTNNVPTYLSGLIQTIYNKKQIERKANEIQKYRS